MAKRRSDGRHDSGKSISIHEFSVWMKNRRWLVVCLSAICILLAISASYYIPASNIRESKISLKYIDNNVFTAQRYSRNRDNRKSIAIKPFATGLSIDNGIILIKSQSFCENVVLDLGLQYNYFYQKPLGKRVDLYRNAPVAVEGIPINFDKSVEFRISNESPMRIDNFRIDGKSTEFSAVVDSDGNVKTPVGTLHVRRWNKKMEHHVIYTYTPVKKMAAVIVKRLGVKQTAKFTDVLTITYSDVSIRRADDILNRLPKTYDEIWSMWNRSDAQKFREAVEARLAVHSARLSETENRLAQLLASNSLLSIDADYRFLSKSMTDDRFSADQAERCIAALKEAIVQLEKDLDIDLPIAAETLVAADTSLLGNINRYNALIVKRATLLNSAGTANPKYLEADKRLRSMHPAISASLQSALQTKQIELEALRNRLAQADREMSSLALLQDSVNRLTRNQRISQSQYVYMTSKRENDPLAINNISEATRVISPATGQPEQPPISPVKAVLLGLIVGGLILPLMMFQMSRLTNSKIRTVDDVRPLGLPLLGTVSLTRPVSRWQKIQQRFGKPTASSELPQFVLYSEENTHSIDELMMLTSNLNYRTGDIKTTPVCLFTSLHTDSGATFMAVNIAHAEARIGKRVLLIDADLSRTSVSLLVGAPQQGLSTWLSSETNDIHSLIHREEAGFDVLPCGTVRPGIAEMMSTGRMSSLIDMLKSQYDFIYIDCTPSEQLASAAILSHIATSTVIVLRSGVTPLETLDVIDKIKTDGHLPTPMLIVNAVNPEA